MKTIILLAVAFCGISAEKVRYDNYQVFRVFPESAKDLDTLLALEKTNAFSFWSDVRRGNQPVDVLVSPHKTPIFKAYLSDNGLPATVMINNVQELIGDQPRSLIKGGKKLEWTNYYGLDDIYAWLSDVVANNSNIQIVTGGTTYEGRKIQGIEITNGANLPGVILESGIHAREWIGPAATSWIVDKIIKSADDSVWRKFNYIYFPSVNPDGYVFSHEQDRMWRKTRTPYKSGSETCYGADPNRNYGYHWNEGGTSDSPCSDLYAGPSAFSEIETKSLSDFLTKVAPTHDLHLAFHSFSQLLMFPWGYTATHTPMHATWQRIGDLAASALEKVHGTPFDVGNIYETIYQTSGTSTEWYYGQFNATIAYTFELRDTGRYGFVLPPDQIIPVAEELIAAVQVILEEYLKL